MFSAAYYRDGLLAVALAPALIAVGCGPRFEDCEASQACTASSSAGEGEALTGVLAGSGGAGRGGSGAGGTSNEGGSMSASSGESGTGGESGDAAKAAQAARSHAVASIVPRHRFATRPATPASHRRRRCRR
jgi:hypothetical protein